MNKRVRNLAVCAAILMPSAMLSSMSACSSSPSTGNSSGSSGSSSGGGSGSSSGSGSGSSSGSSSGGSSGGDASVACNAQFTADTCTQCSACLAPYCCGAINACYADPGCSALLDCVNNCNDMVEPDGSLFPDGGPDADLVDPCVTQCSAVDAGANSEILYNTQYNCYNTSGPGFTLCNETATAPCECN